MQYAHLNNRKHSLLCVIFSIVKTIIKNWFPISHKNSFHLSNGAWFVLMWLLNINYIDLLTVEVVELPKIFFYINRIIFTRTQQMVIIIIKINYNRWGRKLVSSVLSKEYIPHGVFSVSTFLPWFLIVNYVSWSRCSKRGLIKVI